MMVHMGPEAAHPGVTPWGGQRATDIQRAALRSGFPGSNPCSVSFSLCDPAQVTAPSGLQITSVHEGCGASMMAPGKLGGSFAEAPGRGSVESALTGRALVTTTSPPTRAEPGASLPPPPPPPSSSSGDLDQLDKLGRAFWVRE